MTQLIKKSDLVALGASEKNAAAYVDHLNHAMELYSINTPLRISHFLAQVFHESIKLSTVIENLNYSLDGLMRTFKAYYTPVLANQHAHKPEAIANHVYAGRNGNKYPGDGWLYRGRGLIQLTGRRNYADMSDRLMEKLKTVPDFVMSPQAAIDPHWAALTAAAYWDSRNLNKLADKDDVLAITKAVNGGTNGLDDRKRYLKKAKELFL